MTDTGYDTDFTALEQLVSSNAAEYDPFGKTTPAEFDLLNSDKIEVNADPSIIKNKVQFERALVKGISFTLELEDLSDSIPVHLSVNEFRLLCEALKKTTKLRHLNLSCQPHLKEAIKLLEDALKVNTSLYNISLACNNIDVEICKSIGEILKVNKTLRVINIEWSSHMVPDCYKHIAEGLLVNDTLVEMVMGENSLDDEGLQYLKAVVEVNKTIRWLNIDDSNVDNAEWRYVTGKTTENYQNQKLFVKDTMVIIHNIVRDRSVVEKIPVELWCHVFSFVKHVGVFIDFGKRFKIVLDKHNTKH